MQLVRPALGFQAARRTQSPTRSKIAAGRTKSEARSRAREFLATGQGATWKTSDGIGSFIEKVSQPTIIEYPSLHRGDQQMRTAAVSPG